MELNLRTTAKVAAATWAAGYLAGRARAWVHQTLAELGEALDGAFDFDFDDDDAVEPCVCGSTEHASQRLVYVATDALLDNGNFGVMPVVAQFAYFETDPLAIAMTLGISVDVNGHLLGEDHQTWGFARDLLDTALSVPNKIAGQGDVTAQHIDGDVDKLYIYLTDTEGVHHAVEFDAEVLRDFMAATFNLVPGGTENVDVDTAIEHLVNGTWEQ